MIAVDTNVLVYAVRADSPAHSRATRALERLVTDGRPWAVPWPCLHELLAVLTHPRIYDPPTPVPDALRSFEDLLGLPGIRVLRETPRHPQLLGALLTSGVVVGPKVHDARVAAICLGHGVSELWSADRDFSYFPTLRTVNPLIGEVTVSVTAGQRREAPRARPG